MCLYTISTIVCSSLNEKIPTQIYIHLNIILTEIREIIVYNHIQVHTYTYVR